MYRTLETLRRSCPAQNIGLKWIRSRSGASILLWLLLLGLVGAPRAGAAPSGRQDDHKPSGPVKSGASQAGFFIKDTWAPDGPVRAIQQVGSTIYLGGSFTLLGRVSGPAVAFDSDGNAMEPFPLVNGNVLAVEPDGNGGWYLGGNFTSVQGQARNNLAQLDSMGVLTAWNPNVNALVYDISLGNGAVYVGGAFSTVGATPRNYIAAIDTGTGLATPFQPVTDNYVSEVEYGGAVVYLGGNFTNVNGETRNAIAAVNSASGSLEAPFAAPTDYLNTTGLDYADGMLYVAVIANSGNYVRVFDTAASAWLPYTVTTNAHVNDLVYDPLYGFVWIGGAFTVVNGQPRQYLAYFTRSNGVLFPNTCDANAEVIALCKVHIDNPDPTKVGEGIIVGGRFTVFNGQFANGLADITSYGTNSFTAPVPSYPRPGFGRGEVFSVAFANGRSYAGGIFSVVNGVYRDNLAAIDHVSGEPLSWAPGTNGEVQSLLVNGNTVYIGGEFTALYDGPFLVPRNRAASVNATTGSVNSFNPNVDVVGRTTVRSFALNGSSLYMAGTFLTVGGVARRAVAAVNPTTGALLSWNANVLGSVNAMGIVFPIGLEAPTIVLGGQFTQAGGQARTNLAAIDGNTGAALPWNPSPNGTVHSLLVLPSGFGGINRVYAGGSFSTIGGQPRSRLAWVDAAGAASLWAPNPDNIVHGLAQSGNTIIAVGAFTTIGGEARNRIAAVDLTTSLATSWNPNATGGSQVVYVVRRFDGYNYIGGVHTSVGGTSRGYFAAIGIQSETAVEVEGTAEPASWALRVAPNPFRFATTIRFSLASEGRTRVTVYDVAGRRVRDLHEGWLSSGPHQMPWDGRDGAGQATASGIYFVRVQGRTENLKSKVFRQ